MSKHGFWSVDTKENSAKKFVVLQGSVALSDLPESAEKFLIQIIENEGKIEFDSSVSKGDSLSKDWLISDFEYTRKSLENHMFSTRYDLAGCLKETEDGIELLPQPKLYPAPLHENQARKKSAKKVEKSTENTKAFNKSSNEVKTVKAWKYDEGRDILNFDDVQISLENPDHQELLIELVKSGKEGISVEALAIAFGCEDSQDIIDIYEETVEALSDLGFTSGKFYPELSMEAKGDGVVRLCAVSSKASHSTHNLSASKDMPVMHTSAELAR